MHKKSEENPSLRRLARTIQTLISERPFDQNTRRNAEEPFVALCGFDSAQARALLGDAGFDLVVECGIGGTVNRFDEILLYTFPDASRTPAAMWTSLNEDTLDSATAALLNGFGADTQCGVIAQTLARKAISASFVGAFASAIA